jgi:hypothetical protein
MHPNINQMIANGRVADRVSAAERRRAARAARPGRPDVRVASRDVRVVTSWLRVSRRSLPGEGA